MNLCPECRLKNINLIDSNENIICENPEDRALLSDWERWECEDCSYIFEIEDGFITAKQLVGSDKYVIKYRLSIDWQDILNVR